VATAIVSLVGGRAADVGFRRGDSWATPDTGAVNIDGALLEAPHLESAEFPELLIGVAAHEGAHLRWSRAWRRASPLWRYLYNVVEDERIEAAAARRWPPLAAPLETTRRALVRAEPGPRGFLVALFLLVRAPERMTSLLWVVHRRRLRRAMEILTPFPESAAEVLVAVRRLARLVPPEERARPPELPAFGVRGRARRGGSAGEEEGAGGWPFGREDEWSDVTPPELWTDARPDPAGYAAARAAAAADARLVHAALAAAVRGAPRPLARTGLLDRRRLHAWRWDPRVFRTGRPAPRPLTLVLVLDLSGSMRGWYDPVQRIAVAFSEAACRLRHVRLHVYGHAADGDGRPRTEITRFATPARGPVLALGTLPEGANNRDGHALALIARDLAAREPDRRRARLALHLCDEDPLACAYAGLPARAATERARAAFQRSFGPLVTVRFGGPRTPARPDVLPWREGATRALAAAGAARVARAGVGA
jgi:hypothetical protein